MSANRTYIKFICTPLFMLFMNGCANTQVNNDSDALVNATRGAVNMVITDHHVYQKALASETSEVKKAMIYSTLEKVDILRTFETEIGKDFVIEESLNTRKLNDLCWMAKFIRQSKNELPSKDQTIYSDIFTWIGKKEQSWLKKLNQSYSKDELGNDDCRK